MVEYNTLTSKSEAYYKYFFKMDRKPANHCLHPVKRVSEKSPKGYFYTRCASKIWAYCSYCANCYQLDQRKIIGSGCLPEFTGTLFLSDYNFYAVTYTAPSFGRAHFLSSLGSDYTCYCGKHHNEDDPWLGAPIDSSLYHYSLQIKWNRNLVSLLKKTQVMVSAELPGVGYVMAKEWHKRGALHIHAIYRVPKVISEKKALRVLKKSKMERSNGFGWGVNLYIDKLELNQLNKAVNYLTKSLGKNARQQGSYYGIISDQLMAHYSKLDKHAIKTPCNKVGCTGKDCEGKAHQNFGWGGQVITKSTNWCLLEDDVTLDSINKLKQAYRRDLKAQGIEYNDSKLEDTYLSNLQTLEEELSPVDNGFDEARAARLLESFGL